MLIYKQSIFDTIIEGYMTRQQQTKERAEKRSQRLQARKQALKMASFGHPPQEIGPKVDYGVRQVQRWLEKTPYHRRVGRPSS
jgi:transposase-like protein